VGFNAIGADMKLIDAKAECLTCGWVCTSNNAQGVGARHHYLTGHEVVIEISHGKIYKESKECDVPNCKCKKHTQRG
jgi:hypothetical protein